MLRNAVNSSNIAAVGWEQDEDGNAIMEVEFNSGVVYQYTGVPEWLYQGLLYAASPGKYLKANILDSFDGQRIE